MVQEQLPSKGAGCGFAEGCCAQGVPQSPGGKQGWGQCVLCWAWTLQSLLQPTGCEPSRVSSGRAKPVCDFTAVWKFHIVPHGCHCRGDCNAAVYVLFAWVAAGVQASF